MSEACGYITCVAFWPTVQVYKRRNRKSTRIVLSVKSQTNFIVQTLISVRAHTVPSSSLPNRTGAQFACACVHPLKNITGDCGNPVGVKKYKFKNHDADTVQCIYISLLKCDEPSLRECKLNWRTHLRVASCLIQECKLKCNVHNWYVRKVQKKWKIN